MQTARAPSENESYRCISVTPVTGSFAAEIAGVNLAALDDNVFAEIKHAFLRYRVLFFRDQDLTPESQIAFGRRFGALNRHPYVDPMPGYPDAFEIVKEPGDRHHFGNVWHTDLAYAERPVLGTILYGVEVPPAGGDTMFADLQAAYDALSDGMKRLLADLRIVYTNAHTYGKDAARFKAGVSRRMSVRQAEEKEVEHPVVRTHPETGRKGLYISPIHAARVSGMTKAESQPLLDFLARHATQPEFTCRFRWRPGSVAMWDNRCTLHYAVNDFPNARRIMRRVTIDGDAPV